MIAPPAPAPSGAEAHAPILAYDNDASELHEARSNWVYMTTKQLTDYALLDRAGIDGATVLNVGCFHPIDEILFAHRVDRWVAIDAGERTIEVARSAARRSLSDESFGKLEFQVADGTALPFDDGAFDVAISMSTVDHVPDMRARQRFIDEMSRVTRPGGRVVVTVPNRWSRGYAIRTRTDSEGDWFEYCFSPRELKRMIRRAGLDLIEFRSTAEIPVLAPRLIFPKRNLRPLISAYNAVARPFGVRMGVLAGKPA